jgi:hypothetical protein
MELRYYQGRIDITPFCDLSAEESHAFPPNRVSERVVFTPDEAVHYCSAEKMIDIEVLDFACEWDTEPDAATMEWWDDIFNNNDSDYTEGPFPWHRIVETYDKDGDVTFRSGSPVTSITYQGEFESRDDAREYAQGNHLV